MKLYHLVFKDILRRKKRVSYATLGVVIAAMTVVSILTIANAGEARIYAQLEKYGANLNVIPAISNVETSLGDLSMGALAVGDNYIAEDKLVQLREITDGEIKKALDIKDDAFIATIAPKLYVSTEVKNTSLLAVGIDPREERVIKTWWRVQEGTYIEESNHAVIGAQTAELLGLRTGERVTLNNREFVITGILEETGSADDFQVFVPIQTLQAAFDKNGVISSVDIRALCNGCPVELIADSINQNVTGVRALAVKQVAETEMGMMEKMNNLMLALAGITLIIGIFGVVNTMMTSVYERIKDIGIMRAVGASRIQIIRTFIYEAIVIGIIGGIVGYLTGTLAAYLIGPLVFEGTSISIIPIYLPLSLLLAVIVAVISTTYPAFRATTIKVSDSFRAL
ncbi:MAG: ABC transporter permease [Dehalococcoidales bacterium]|nr:MAG: ABC transporter permease [Dehalococcoidales bacterium]